MPFDLLIRGGLIVVGEAAILGGAGTGLLAGRLIRGRG
jgi:hypothetical protein